MLVVFEGGDVVRAKAEAARRAKGAEIVRVGEGGVAFGEALGYMGQAGMFASVVTIILERPLESAEGKEFLFSNMDALISASELVIAIQPEVGALDRKKFPKKVVFESFDLKNMQATESRATAFGLLDAYQAGDRKSLWVEYRSLIAGGLEAEEIHGTLAWGLRGMVLAGKVGSAAEAGMKDYPFRKAKAAVAKRGLAATETALGELTELYHRARLGYGSLELLLESFLLKK